MGNEPIRRHCCKFRHCCRDDSCLERIEDKLVEALPGLADEEKPPEYVDAPQWQKDAWDSDTRKVLSGGWCAPTACQAGICGSLIGRHDEECAYGASLRGGWVMPSGDVVIPQLPLLSLPVVSVRRGGIKWARFPVRTHVSGHKRFLRRKQWRLEVQYVDGGRSLNHYMEFTNESAARNAEQIIKFMMQWVNEESAK